MRRNADVSAGQRIVRLLFMACMIIVAYLTLSLFDRAAHADAGVVDQIGKADPVATAGKLAADSGKGRSPAKISPPKVSPPNFPARKLAAPKVVSAPKVSAPKVSAPKVSVPKVSVPKVSAPKAPVPKASVPRVSVSKVAVHPIRSAKVVTRAAVSLPQLPALPQLLAPQLPALPALPQLPAYFELPAVPVLPQQSSALVHGPSLSLASVSTTLLTSPAPLCMIDLLAAPDLGGFFGAAAGQLDRRAPSRPQAQPAPGLPDSPGQPDHQSTGHVRDSGGGSAPAMGTVSSSWRPEVVAAGITAPSDLTGRGRTVRYSGPPS